MGFGIKPLGNRVVIKRVEAQEKSAGGILLASQAKEVPNIGDVVAVGEGKKDVEMLVKEDNRVIFSQYSGTTVKFEGEEYIILDQEDILAILK